MIREELSNTTKYIVLSYVVYKHLLFRRDWKRISGSEQHECLVKIVKMFVSSSDSPLILAMCDLYSVPKTDKRIFGCYSVL